MEDLSAERAARNEATFRDSNERIEKVADKYGLRDSLPFICECADENCTQIIRLQRDEYEEIRAKPDRFANAPGHEDAAGPHATLVERREGYSIVDKVGEAGKIASELDPRSHG